MKNVILSAMILGLTVVAAPVHASGSGSSGGGGYTGGSFSERNVTSAADRLERRGRSQIRKRITCKKCDYHKNLNQQTAPEIAQAVRAGNFDLKSKDAEAVLFFLRRRYGV